MRKKITLPGAGETLPVPMTGRSVIIEIMPVYKKLSDIPLISVEGDGFQSLPMYPRSIYGNDKEFNELVITGTAESDGGTAYLLTVPQCLDTDLNVNTGSQYEATAGTTFSITSTDVAQSIPQLDLSDADGNLPRSIILTARDNPISYAFNTAPDQTNFGHVLLPPNITSGSEREADFIEVEGIDFILSLQFISANAGAAGELIVTPRY